MNYLRMESPYVLIILSAMMAINSLSTDVYLPAMPAMEESLGNGAELTITGYLLGFMVGQLLWGPISDRTGRKTPLYIGSFIFVIGTIGCAVSSSMTELVICRIFQALGACVAPMLSRTMIRDMYSTQEAASKLSTLTLIMSIAPILGPLLGGYIVSMGTWNDVFWMIAFIGVIVGISTYFLPETLGEDKRIRGTISSTWTVYGNLLKNPSFMKYVMIIAFFYMAIYALIAASPYVYIVYYGIAPEEYGYYFALNIIGVMTMSFFNKNLVRIYSLDTLLKGATIVTVFFAILSWSVIFFNCGGFTGIVVTLLGIFSMNGILGACTMAAALDKAGHHAGSATAVVSSLQYGSGIISSMLVSFFFDGTPYPMIIVILICVIISATFAWYHRGQS